MPGVLCRWLCVALAWAALAGCTALTGPRGAQLVRSPSGQGARVKVVSYNIARGLWWEANAPAQRRLSRSASTVREALRRHPALAGADVVGLQEVCGARQLKSLLQLEGYQVYFDPIHPNAKDACQGGQAILSRYPILRGGRITLPRLRAVTRTAIWADLALPDGRPLRVYNLHLDNRGESLWAARGRWTQMKVVLDHYRRWRADNPDAGVVILGDFNALGELVKPWERERAIRETSRLLRSALEGYHATHLLSYQTDWIFYGGLELESAQVVDLLLSDHYPVVATLRAPEAGPTPP